MGTLSIQFLKTSFLCLGVVNFISTPLTREEMIQGFIDSMGMRNGEFTIKVQDGRFVHMEVISKLRNDEEGLRILEDMRFRSV